MIYKIIFYIALAEAKIAVFTYLLQSIDSFLLHQMLSENESAFDLIININHNFNLLLHIVNEKGQTAR